jgi:phosphate transport system protein
VSDVFEPAGGAAAKDSRGMVDRRVARLFALVREAMAGATTALLDEDRDLGRSIVARDQAIDELTAQVGQSMWEMITGPRFDATRRRQAVLILLMLTELERSGDLAEHIAQRSLTDLGREMTALSRGLVQRMSEVASAMWDMARIAFVERAALGTALDEADEELDVLHESLSREVASGHMNPSVAVQVALLSRFYERLGDHAVNLTRRVEALAADYEKTGTAG